MVSYPRYVTPNHKPFDPVELARETEKVVCKGNEKKYSSFRTVGVYGGIGTGYACGCCLRCVFCWVDKSRDFPERFGSFRAPEEAFNLMAEAARRRGVSQLRISGGEPTLGKEHLLALLECFERSEFKLFILETNGILLGVDPDYVKSISKFKRVHVRLSVKAGTPEAFSRKTGAKSDSSSIPFRAIENLLREGVSFHVAAMSADPRVMAPEERHSLLQRLAGISPDIALNLEEEIVDPYPQALARLRHAGIELSWPIRNTYPAPNLGS